MTLFVVNCAGVDRKMMKQLHAKQNTSRFKKVVYKINVKNRFGNTSMCLLHLNTGDFNKLNKFPVS